MRRTTAKILLIAVYILTVAFALLCVWRGLAMCGEELIYDPVYFVVGGIGFLLSWLVAPLLHEIGHLALASSNGFVWNEFSFLFFHFRKNGQKTVCRIGKDNGVAGECKIIPTRKDNMRKRYFAATFGGILFTSIPMLAALFLFVFSFFTEGMYFTYLFFMMWLPAFFFYTAFNAVPFENEYGKSDGGVLLGLKKRNASELTALNILRIQSELYRGVRFSQIEEKYYFSAPQIIESDPNFIAILQLRYYYYRDIGRGNKVTETVERMKSLYDDLPEQVKTELAVDLFYEGVLSRDSEQVKRYYKDCKRLQGSGSYLSAKVSACRYAYKNKIEETDEYILAAIKRLNKDPLRGRIASERDLLQKLKEI